MVFEYNSHPPDSEHSSKAREMDALSYFMEQDILGVLEAIMNELNCTKPADPFSFTV